MIFIIITSLLQISGKKISFSHFTDVIVNNIYAFITRNALRDKNLYYMLTLRSVTCKSKINIHKTMTR